MGDCRVGRGLSVPPFSMVRLAGCKRSSRSSSPVLPAAHGGAQVADDERQVTLRCSEIPVPERPLHIPKMGAAAQNVGRHGVSERVAGFGDAGLVHDPGDHADDVFWS